MQPCPSWASPSHREQCINGDFGSYQNLGLATVTISGTATPYPLAAFGELCTGVCASLAGTYVVACNEPNMWCIKSYVCRLFGVFDYYYIQFIFIQYTSSSILIRFGSYVRQYAVGAEDPPETDVLFEGTCPDEVPTSTCTLSTFTCSRALHEWSSTATHDDNNFIPPGCSEPAIVQRRACAPGSKTLTKTFYDQGVNSCKVSDYTVALSIGSPS